MEARGHNARTIEAGLLRDIQVAIASHSKCLSEGIIDIDHDPRGCVVVPIMSTRGHSFVFPVNHKLFDLLSYYFNFRPHWLDTADVPGFTSGEEAHRIYKESMGNILNRILVAHGLQTYLLLMMEHMS